MPFFANIRPLEFTHGNYKESAHLLQVPITRVPIRGILPVLALLCSLQVEAGSVIAPGDVLDALTRILAMAQFALKGCASVLMRLSPVRK